MAWVFLFCKMIIFCELLYSVKRYNVVLSNISCFILKDLYSKDFKRTLNLHPVSVDLLKYNVIKTVRVKRNCNTVS